MKNTQPKQEQTSLMNALAQVIHQYAPRNFHERVDFLKETKDLFSNKIDEAIEEINLLTEIKTEPHDLSFYKYAITQGDGPTYFVHPTHKMRYSDASTFDEICDKCGLTDGSKIHLEGLEDPCKGKVK